MGKSLIFALCWAVLILSPAPGNPADLLQAGQGAPRQGVFFDIPTSFRMLDELEQCRITTQEVETLRLLDRNHEELEKIYKARIEILEKNQADLLRMNEAAIKNAELARESAEGKWHEKAFNVGKWLGIGILVGLAL